MLLKNNQTQQDSNALCIKISLFQFFTLQHIYGSYCRRSAMDQLLTSVHTPLVCCQLWQIYWQYRNLMALPTCSSGVAQIVMCQHIDIYKIPYSMRCCSSMLLCLAEIISWSSCCLSRMLMSML
jgi:hypothetical protein